MSKQEQLKRWLMHGVCINGRLIPHLFQPHTMWFGKGDMKMLIDYARRMNDMLAFDLGDKRTLRPILQKAVTP